MLPELLQFPPTESVEELATIVPPIAFDQFPELIANTPPLLALAIALLVKFPTPIDSVRLLMSAIIAPLLITESPETPGLLLIATLP